MMTWRLHLTNQAIQHLYILEGDPPLLVAWSRRDHVIYYHLETGVRLGEHTFISPDTSARQEAAWHTFLAEFKTPNNAYLPIVKLPDMSIHTTDDGRMHLYHLEAGTLHLENDGKEDPLETDTSVEFLASGLDRFLGLVAAVDKSGRLFLYQQHIRVGAFAIPLKFSEDNPAHIAIPRGSAAIYLSDGHSILLVDSSGQVRKQSSAHYVIGHMACSQQGNYLMTSDADAGVIRVYDGAELTLLYQRFAVDLMAEATQVQLMADLPPLLVAPSALTIDNEGVLAFAMSGVICVTDIEHMDALPRPQALL